MAELLLSEPYDIVIVGAGPAGSSAARTASENGARVLLIDRRQRIGVPVQCAELVSQWISCHMALSGNCIIQATQTMVTHLSDGESRDGTFEMKSPGYALDRSLFDKELASHALSAGARISIGTRAIGLSSRGLWVEKDLKRIEIQSKVIIGADGIHSLIAQWAGLPSARAIVALQYEVLNPGPQSEAEVFFHPNYEGGYGWFFPKGRTANVGLGIVPEKTSLLPSLLEQFLGRLTELKKTRDMAIVGRTGGSVPSEGPRQTVFRNILLAGDAAGHAHPITGAGILNAVIGGEIAGRIAAEAVQKGDLEYLQRYEAQWQGAFGDSLGYGAMKRGVLERNWKNSEMGFENLIRNTWVGFKEYYEDRKKKRKPAAT